MKGDSVWRPAAAVFHLHFFKLPTALSPISLVPALLVVACALAARPAAAQEQAAPNKPDLSAYISPDLPEAEQGVIRTTLENMPAQLQRDIASRPAALVHIAVVEGGTGVIHYSRPEDAGGLVVDRVSQPDDYDPVSDAVPFVDPANLDPGLNPGTGPYRRIYTHPVAAAPQPELNQGNFRDLSVQHSWVAEGSPYIPCNAGVFKDGDIGYSYMGGWSGTWNTVSGQNAEARAIDAGLQYSPALNNYAMIMTIAGGAGSKAMVIHQSNTEKSEMPPRIQCTDKDDWADIYFWAYGSYQLPSVAPACWENPKAGIDFLGFPSKACNTYTLALAVATDQFIGQIGGISTYYIFWFSPNYEYGGWGELVPFTAPAYGGKTNVPGYVPRAPCANCTFKWMTSIAQPTQDLSDNSFYNTRWSNFRLTNWPTNDDMELLTKAEANCSEYPNWNATYPTVLNTDCRNSPANLTGVQKSVNVTGYYPYAEDDLIRLFY